MPMLWDEDGYIFLMICGNLVEDSRAESGLSGAKGPLMSMDSILAFGQMMEAHNGS